jgi:hypothetical protein
MRLWCPACEDSHPFTTKETEMIVYSLLEFSTSGDMTEEPACLNEIRTLAMGESWSLVWRQARIRSESSG